MYPVCSDDVNAKASTRERTRGGWSGAQLLHIRLQPYGCGCTAGRGAPALRADQNRFENKVASRTVSARCTERHLAFCLLRALAEILWDACEMGSASYFPRGLNRRLTWGNSPRCHSVENPTAYPSHFIKDRFGELPSRTFGPECLFAVSNCLSKFERLNVGAISVILSTAHATLLPTHPV